MKLKKYLNILSKGTACFTIKGYCEEYREGLECLKAEPWYEEAKDRKVTHVVTVGGICYPVETIIELE